MRRTALASYAAAVAVPSAAYALHPHGSFIFPPLGAISLLIVPAVVAINYVVQRFPWDAMQRKASVASVVITLALTLGGLFLYVHSALTYICPVPYPGKHSTIFVSVGTERTSWAKAQYPDDSDAEMLARRGLSDAAVKKLWTAESVDAGRFKLFSYYTIMLISFSSLCGALSRLKEVLQ